MIISMWAFNLVEDEGIDYRVKGGGILIGSIGTGEVPPLLIKGTGKMLWEHVEEDSSVSPFHNARCLIEAADEVQDLHLRCVCRKLRDEALKFDFNLRVGCVLSGLLEVH